MTYWLPIPGTWALFRQTTGTRWHDPGSPLVGFLEHAGLHLLPGSRPYVWSTDVDGLPWDDRHSDWQAGGFALYDHLMPSLAGPLADTLVPYTARNLVAHSHGLQPVLYACALGLRVHRLLSLMSPIRHDLLPIAKAARANIGEWRHVYTDDSDQTQLRGSWFDGKMGNERKHPLADVNVRIPGLGHSGLVSDPRLFPHWIDDGLADWLQLPEKESV